MQLARRLARRWPAMGRALACPAFASRGCASLAALRAAVLRADPRAAAWAAVVSARPPMLLACAGASAGRVCWPADPTARPAGAWGTLAALLLAPRIDRLLEMMACRDASSFGSLVAVALGPTMLSFATCSSLPTSLLGEAGCFLLTFLKPASLRGATAGFVLTFLKPASLLGATAGFLLTLLLPASLLGEAVTFLPLAALAVAWDLAAGSAAG